MIVFAAVGGVCGNSVILPDGDVLLYTGHSDRLEKDFLYMLFRRKESNVSNPFAKPKGALIPYLGQYETLPYKRQPLSDQLDRYTLELKTKYLGMPLSSDYVALDKIKNFYMNCKKYYAAVACGSSSSNADSENGETALITFNSYSDAIRTLRYDSKKKIWDLLGGKFKLYNTWYAYIRMEYMNHPICLLGEISSHVGSYSLGMEWCYYLVSFLRNGFVASISLTSYFDFIHIHRNESNKIVHYDS
jgi:hypothetical protein